MLKHTLEWRRDFGVGEPSPAGAAAGRRLGPRGRGTARHRCRPGNSAGLSAAACMSPCGRETILWSAPDTEPQLIGELTKQQTPDNLRLSDYDHFMGEGWMWLAGNDESGATVLVSGMQACGCACKCPHAHAITPQFELLCSRICEPQRPCKIRPVTPSDVPQAPHPAGGGARWCAV